MSDTQNSRHCPTCGSLGIVRQSGSAEGSPPLVDPVMVCPLCETDFVATGMTFHLFGRPPVDEGREALEAWCEVVIDQWLSEG